MKYVKYCLAEISVYTLPFMGSRVKGTKRRWPRELWKTTAKDLKLREAVTNGGFETSIIEKQLVFHRDRWKIKLNILPQPPLVVYVLFFVRIHNK